MTKLEKAIISLNASRSETETTTERDPRAVTLVTLVYLVALLSVPLTDIAKVLWFGVYPIVLSMIMAGSYARIFLRSLIVLPFILLIAVFNPILDREPVFMVGSVVVSRGWITFVSIVLRGLWAVQAALAMTFGISFTGVCRGLNRLGVPKILTTQMMMVYRYISVLLEEALRMKRARESRGFGRKSMPLRMWGNMVGELFIRTIDRARTIHNSMLSRGFNGEIPYYGSTRSWSAGDSLFVIGWLITISLLRFVSPELLFKI